MVWIKTPAETIIVMDLRPDVNRPAASEHCHMFHPKVRSECKRPYINQVCRRRIYDVQQAWSFQFHFSVYIVTKYQAYVL